MTEDEARTKWCPYTGMRAVDFVEPDTFTTKSACNCMAADCACWVQDGLERYDVGGGKTREFSDGHCGLIR